MYVIVRNGTTNLEAGVMVEERPSIPAAEYKYDTIDIPGRDGELYEKDSAVKDIEIKISFIFKCTPEKWQYVFRKARQWLSSNKDNRLILSDMPDYFYKVKHTKIENSEREVKQIGQFSATFVCEGYQYLKKGAETYKVDEVLYNPYSVAHPIYKIKGNGKCTLIVNQKEFTAEVGQNVTIDTDLMISYREDGRIMNTSVTGDYQDLYLCEEENTIEISENFNLEVIPNWRCI